MDYNLGSRSIFLSDNERAALESGTLMIHRIFPFDRFVDLVRDGKLALVKPKKWDDPYENPLNRPINVTDTGRTIRTPHLDNMLFGQCWSLRDESDAMWRIYSPDKRGVLVSANAKELLLGAKTQFQYPMEQLFLGKVQYKTESELRQMLESEDFLKGVLTSGMYSSSGANVLMYKRDAFSHEAEMRLVLARHISKVPGDVALIDIPIERYVTGITLDPRLSTEDFERVCHVIRALGYRQDIRQSQLYAVPKLNPTIPSLEWIHQRPTEPPENTARSSSEE